MGTMTLTERVRDLAWHDETGTLHDAADELERTGWKPMETAPKDGTEILVCRDNGSTWDFFTVWWSEWSKEYPWSSQTSRYPADRFDYWMTIPHPSRGR